jgi:hypothetical protein
MKERERNEQKKHYENQHLRKKTKNYYENNCFDENEINTTIELKNCFINNHETKKIESDFAV